METCQEKIISLELQDPSNNSDLINDKQITKNNSLTTTNDDIVDNLSNRIGGVRDYLQRQPLQLTDDDYPSVSHLETIVEVVSPFIDGDGNVKRITVGKSDEEMYPSYSESMRSFGDSSEEKVELSLNDKMKNVLQELLENERVKLNLSRSLDESESEQHSIQDEQQLDEILTNLQRAEEAAERYITDELNKNLETDYDMDVDIDVDVDDADGCQIYENPNTDAPFIRDSIETILDATSKVEKQVSDFINEANKSDDDDDDDDGTNPDSNKNTTEISGNNSTVTAAPQKSAGNNNHSNTNNKKKKRKNKKKK